MTPDQVTNPRNYNLIASNAIASERQLHKNDPPGIVPTSHELVANVEATQAAVTAETQFVAGFAERACRGFFGK